MAESSETFENYYFAMHSHANVDTTLNVYTQVLDASVRAAVAKVGDELFTIVHKLDGAPPLTH
jgi:hypothetical protein